jgi:hypothetical protein
MEAVRIPFTTDGDGEATVYTGRVAGTIFGVYIDHGSGLTELENTVNITVTDEATGATIFGLTDISASGRYLVLNQAVSASGVPIADVYSGPPAVGRLKVVVTDADDGDGDPREGSVTVYVDGSVSEATAFAERVLS